MLDVIPLNRRVLAKVLESKASEKKTDVGIILQEEAGKKLDYLEVVAVDPQITEIKIGDLIYISKYSGDQYRDHQTEYHYVMYQDIIGRKKRDGE